MKIEKVVLQNIGVYVNKNEFDLQSDKPIILIGGLNGRGKTTFLEAILFALYGRRAIDTSQNLEDYLRKISNITGDCKDCYIELHFSVKEQGKIANYMVKRFWNIERIRLVLKTCVSKDGEENTALSENWDLFVEELLPRAIASFFFFDGEKIADLAAAENTTHIQSSIVSLLGVDIINQLISDLQMILVSNQKQIKVSHYKTELERLDKQIERQNTELMEIDQEWEQVKRSRDQLDSERVQIENEYAVAGGDYVESQKKYKQFKQQVQLQIEENQNQLLDLAASDLPLKLVEPMLQTILDDAEKEQEQRELCSFVRQFPYLYEKYSGGNKWSEELENFFISVKNRTMKMRAVYNLDEDSMARLAEMPIILKEELLQSTNLIKLGQRLSVRNKELDNYLAIEVNDEKIKELQQHMIENSYKIGQTESELKNVEEKQVVLHNSISNLEKMRKQLLGQVVKEQEASEENHRIMYYAQQQIEVMRVYKKQLQAMKADELAKQMTECFKKIIAKDGLIHKIEIDHETLEFRYYNKNGQQIDHRMLSSGEKQMLVIAMLWALGICSKSEFPLIIDTPLARLDSVHRASLIENYFPKASEQVIILSTDQEITRQDYQSLQKYVGREYTLIYDDDTMSSSIHTGYFGGYEK